MSSETELITVTLRLSRARYQLLSELQQRECRSRNRQVQFFVEKALDEIAKLSEEVTGSRG